MLRSDNPLCRDKVSDKYSFKMILVRAAHVINIENV